MMQMSDTNANPPKDLGIPGNFKSNRVIIIGGGVGGSAVAARLAKEKADWDILLLEKNDHLGGRLDQLLTNGFRFDTGPTLLLAPEIYRSAFAAVGSTIEDWSPLLRVEPAYTVFLSDNTRVILTSDMAVMREQLEALEPGCFPRFLAYMEEARINFERGFASRPFQSPDNSIWVRPYPMRDEQVRDGHVRDEHLRDEHVRDEEMLCEDTCDEDMRTATRRCAGKGTAGPD